MTEKHAYLIICHDNFEQLELLLKLIDDERNDIYIHVDKKAKNCPFNRLQKAVTRSRLAFTERIRVTWGGYSQVKCETILLKAATKEPHAYYHLLSGADLPIKSQDCIHGFFKENSGGEFISVAGCIENETELKDRIRYYRLFQDAAGGKGRLRALLSVINEALVSAQKFMNVDRTKKHETVFYKGSNWFSISHNAAEFAVFNEKKLRKALKHSLCADEILMQTLLMMSPYKEKIAKNCLREMDWTRGEPYVFRAEDFGLLTNSKNIFARKFDIRADREIVEKIFAQFIVES